jgi:hypothetical protein
VTIYSRLNRPFDVVERYKEMLSHVSNTKITRNECTDAINNVLDTVAVTIDMLILSQVEEMNA